LIASTIALREVLVKAPFELLPPSDMNLMPGCFEHMTALSLKARDGEVHPLKAIPEV
jgi:hypothetical protein